MRHFSPAKLLRLLLVWCALGGSAGHAQIKGQAPSQPDVLILVFSVPNGPDQIGLTYPGVVSHAVVQRDIKALQAATGWAVTRTHISDKLPPVRKAVGKMTEADFTVSDAVAPSARYLPLDPFVQAFRPYRHVALTFFVGSGFNFQGLRNYSDSHVRIALEQRGATYTYQIFILDEHFGRLKLPRYELSAANTRSARGGVSPWLLAFVALAAVGTGCAVYAVLARNA